MIEAVRAAHPDFLFMAEAYWDMEWPLQQLGFDYCYDKRLYDRLLHEGPASVRGHLQADIGYQRRLVRFLENHDEPRAAAEFAPDAERAAAVAVATLPGATLWHEGQFEGWRVRLPVFLDRRPAEPVDDDLRRFYLALLPVAHEVRRGEWALCTAAGWPDNASFDQLLSWCWADGERRFLDRRQRRRRAGGGADPRPVDRPRGQAWRLEDLLSKQVFERDGTGILTDGLFVELPPWGVHVLAWSPVA